MEHQPVLLQEALEGLALKADKVYVDATFGRGGHSRALLDRLGPGGRLYAFDRDLEAVMVGQQITDPRFKMIHAPFSSLKSALRGYGVDQVDGILMDLGVSSPQLDSAERGFSFRREGPLDMRMDTTSGVSAADYINAVEESELIRVLKEYGEERFAKKIARAIIAARPLASTLDLARVVASCVPRTDRATDPATRTFQAIRIAVNRELEEVEETLPQALDMLAPGGRLAVISFHSLEDRLVKQFMARHSTPPEIPRGIAIRDCDRPRPPLKRVGRAIFPGEEELTRNPRARSAVLRVAEKEKIEGLS